MSPTCPPLPPNAYDAGIPIHGSFTFQRVVQTIGWICFGSTALLCIGLCILHFRQYRAPNEQRNVFRIIIFPVVACLISVVCIHTYRNSGYIAPIASLYEAVALVALYLLYVHYIAPEPRSRATVFRELEYTTKKGEVKPGQGYVLLRSSWRILFTYLVAYFILVVAAEITQATGVYCETSNKPHFAHVWIQAFELVATIVAIITIFRFQRTLKLHMPGRKALPKLVVFKLFVIITTIQRFIFSIIGSHVEGNDKITHGDITIGLQSLLICIEALVTQIAFFFCFGAKEFSEGMHRERKEGVALRPLSAFIHALNPADLVVGIGQAYGVFVWLIGWTFSNGNYAVSAIVYRD